MKTECKIDTKNNTICNNIQQLQLDVFFVTWGGILVFAVPMLCDYRDHTAALAFVNGDDGLGVQVLLMVNKIVLGLDGDLG